MFTPTVGYIKKEIEKVSTMLKGGGGPEGGCIKRLEVVSTWRT